MPDFPRNPVENDSDPQPDPATRYTIRRKGSVYNIVGPEGRVFTKYKSASVVGPRWEELTHTPWPYSSSAFESGTRLWQLGIIDRKDVGKTELAPIEPKPRRRVRLEDAPEPVETDTQPSSAAEENAKAANSPTAKPRTELKPLKSAPKQLSLLDGPPVAPTQPASPETAPAPQSPAPEKPKASRPAPVRQQKLIETSAKSKPARKKSSTSAKSRKSRTRSSSTAKAESAPAPVSESPTQPVMPVPLVTVLALPAPRIDLEEHTRLIQALRRNPKRLFDDKMRTALQHEVEYHRPYSRWAQTLLTMLVRYEKRQNRSRNTVDSKTILAKHIAWQEEKMRSAPSSS